MPIFIFNLYNLTVSYSLNSYLNSEIAFKKSNDNSNAKAVSFFFYWFNPSLLFSISVDFKPEQAI